jgi:hypothetical protein
MAVEQSCRVCRAHHSRETATFGFFATEVTEGTEMGRQRVGWVLNPRVKLAASGSSLPMCDPTSVPSVANPLPALRLQLKDMLT